VSGWRAFCPDLHQLRGLGFTERSDQTVVASPTRAATTEGRRPSSEGNAKAGTLSIGRLKQFHDLATRYAKHPACCRSELIIALGSDDSQGKP